MPCRAGGMDGSWRGVRAPSLPCQAHARNRCDGPRFALHSGGGARAAPLPPPLLPPPSHTHPPATHPVARPVMRDQIRVCIQRPDEKEKKRKGKEQAPQEKLCSCALHFQRLGFYYFAAALQSCCCPFADNAWPASGGGGGGERRLCFFLLPYSPTPALFCRLLRPAANKLTSRAANTSKRRCMCVRVAHARTPPCKETQQPPPRSVYMRNTIDERGQTMQAAIDGRKTPHTAFLVTHRYNGRCGPSSRSAVCTCPASTWVKSSERSQVQINVKRRCSCLWRPSTASS